MASKHKAVEVLRNLKPRCIMLPLDSNKYFPILDPSQTVGMQSGLVTLMPDENVGEHSTSAHEEAIIVMEGRGEVQAEDCKYMQVESGHVIYMPPHTRHNVFNTGEVPLRYIYVVSRVS